VTALRPMLSAYSDPCCAPFISVWSLGLRPLAGPSIRTATSLPLNLCALAPIRKRSNEAKTAFGKVLYI
jgi:hypothetical protein